MPVILALGRQMWVDLESRVGYVVRFCLKKEKKTKTKIKVGFFMF
jgi:hypothetical protein